MWALLDAFASLHRRGTGPEAWASPLTTNPLAFLLDTMSDAVFVRGADGSVVFRNRAADRLDGYSPSAPPSGGGRRSVTVEEAKVGTRLYRRRFVTFGIGERQLILEMFTESQKTDSGR